MKTLTVKLSIQELQAILHALGNLPYVQVQELIDNIQLQATPQLQKMNGMQGGAKAGTAKNIEKNDIPETV